jgi:imidazole glycerol-phosphate synthase subunit HisF
MLMIIPRIIPVLLLQNKGLVKSIKFKDYQYIGDPINAVRIFNEKEVDEICLLDINASKEGKEPNYKLIEEIASEAFIPFSYGGGIKTFEQGKRILKLGAEKLILNTVLFTDTNLVRQLADFVGSQSVVASIDVKKNIWGKYMIYDHRKKATLSNELLPTLKKLVSQGVGELIINSVDLDGTMKGLDTRLIQDISKSLNIPVIACGGTGNIEHTKGAIAAGADAVAAGSIFVFHGKHKAVLINYPTRTELIKNFL